MLVSTLLHMPSILGRSATPRRPVLLLRPHLLRCQSRNSRYAHLLTAFSFGRLRTLYWVSHLHCSLDWLQVWLAYIRSTSKCHHLFPLVTCRSASCGIWLRTRRSVLESLLALSFIRKKAEPSFCRFVECHQGSHLPRLLTGWTFVVLVNVELVEMMRVAQIP